MGGGGGGGVEEPKIKIFIAVFVGNCSGAHLHLDWGIHKRSSFHQTLIACDFLLLCCHTVGGWMSDLSQQEVDTDSCQIK